MIREGIDLGMCFLDTAENYDDGNSERIIAKAIKGKRDRVIVATKISPDHHRFDDVIWSAERSLQRLEIDCIDLYQVHWPNPVVPVIKASWTPSPADDELTSVNPVVASGVAKEPSSKRFCICPSNLLTPASTKRA